MGWYDHGVWRIPLLWVLFTGYAWIVVGLGLLGLSHLYPSLVSASPALHALTVGGIGVFTVGMMARVALGHTGRPLIPAKAINVAFVVINLAAVIRTFGPVLMPSWYVSWVMLAGLLWTVTFVIFTLIYAPILLKARADGRPD